MQCRVILILIFSLFLSAAPANAAKLLLESSSSGNLSRVSALRKTELNTAESLETITGEAVVLGNANLNEEMAKRLNDKGLVSAIEPGLGRFILYRGQLLLACSRDERILLANADVELAANSIVYICDNGFGTCEILNLHDEHFNDVKVHVGERVIGLPPGCELILTSCTDAEFDDVHLCRGICFRSVLETSPVPTIKAFSAQFSLVSAAQLLPGVLKMVRSRTKEAYKIIKTAAAVYAVSGYPDDFRYTLRENSESTLKTAQQAN